MTTPHEFGRLVEEMTSEVTDAFENDTTGRVLIRHFHFIHQNITFLTQEVMRHQTERQEVYEYMMDNAGFRTAIRPLLHRFRQRTRRQGYHPYHRSPSPSSSNHDEPPTLSVVIHDEEPTPIESPPITQASPHPSPPGTNDNNDSPTSSTTTDLFAQFEPICGRCMRYGHEAYDCDNGQPTELVEHLDSQEEMTNKTNSPIESFHTANDELPGPSRNHPIVIEEDKCTRCNQTGHVYDDCDTPIKKPGECDVCEWTKQTVCNHYEPTPAWLRELRKQVGQRQRRLAIVDALSPSQ